MDIYLASNNPHKVQEFTRLSHVAGRDDLRFHAAVACGGMPEVEETGDTFVANARLKALALLPRVPTGAMVLADDSGLEVAVLKGAPGVYSARFAGAGASDAANNALLLDRLKSCEAAQRTARFVCCLVLMRHHPPLERAVTGFCQGRITSAPRGQTGFGYDPLFVPDGDSRSFAEMAPSEKEAISHRGDAWRNLLVVLQEL